MSHQAEPDFYGDGSDHEGHMFECDAKGCTHAYTGIGDFQAVWEDAKKDGWRCVPMRVGFKIAEWKHLCPQHKEEHL